MQIEYLDFHQVVSKIKKYVCIIIYCFPVQRSVTNEEAHVLQKFSIAYIADV